MSGSDGVTLDGMYHEEHALPAFVHARGRDQLRLPSVILKGETPVIYFYTDRAPEGPRRRPVPPGGLDPVVSAGAGRRPAALAGGPGHRPAGRPDRLVRRRDPARRRAPRAAPDGRRLALELRPPGRRRVRPHPGPDEGGQPGRVRAVPVLPRPGPAPRCRSGSRPTRGARSRSAATSRHGSGHVFILRVEGGRGAYAYRPALAARRDADGRHPLDGGRPAARRVRRRRSPSDLRRRLVESGLFERRPGRWSTPGGPATSGPRASAPCSCCPGRGPTPSSRCRSSPGRARSSG